MARNGSHQSAIDSALCGMMDKTWYCSACREECDIAIDDASFDHGFGTEYVMSTMSSCCEADLLTPGDMERLSESEEEEREAREQEGGEADAHSIALAA